MQWQIAMAMTNSSERKSPSMPPSQDAAATMIGDFIAISMTISDNDLHLIRVTSPRLDAQLWAILEVEIWRMVSLWMFLLTVLFAILLYFFESQPSTMGIGTGFDHLQR